MVIRASKCALLFAVGLFMIGDRQMAFARKFITAIRAADALEDTATHQ